MQVTTVNFVCINIGELPARSVDVLDLAGESMWDTSVSIFVDPRCVLHCFWDDFRDSSLFILRG